MVVDGTVVVPAIAFQLIQFGEDYGTRDFLQKQLAQDTGSMNQVHVIMEGQLLN
jgi:hypothetical protein